LKLHAQLRACRNQAEDLITRNDACYLLSLQGGFDPGRLTLSMLALEELHCALVLFCCGSARKRAEIAPAPGSWINFS
jgi:hypothetical protein